jgi:hypothetical protein
MALNNFKTNSSESPLVSPSKSFYLKFRSNGCFVILLRWLLSSTTPISSATFIRLPKVLAK